MRVHTGSRYFPPLLGFVQYQPGPMPEEKATEDEHCDLEFKKP